MQFAYREELPGLQQIFAIYLNRIIKGLYTTNVFGDASF